MPMIPGDEARVVELPEMGAMLYLEARAYKAFLGSIKGDVWRSERDSDGGMWTVGDLEDGTDADGTYHKSGIRVIYEKNQYAAEKASHELLKVVSDFGAADRAIRVRAQQKMEPVPEWDAEHERLGKLKADLEAIRDSKETIVWILPDREPVKVQIAY